MTSKVGRKSKLTPELQQEIVDNLTLGCTVRDVCELAGISQETYFQWVKKPEFSEAITQAQAKARRAAVVAVRVNLADTRNKVTETVTFEETRLRWRKTKDSAGNVIGEEQQPYTYRKTTVMNRETLIPPDWRAGIEYLKRRDNRNWSDKITVTFDDLRNQAVNDIRAGILTYEAIAAEDDELAQQLFELAGVPIEAR